jgi:hypothetical protein
MLKLMNPMMMDANEIAGRAIFPQFANESAA